ncbi:MAG TPA: hypothetical protein VKB19_09060 [Pedobacter sp.]|nr:hypothetical protein [Pedobacter sp.]
MKKVLYLFVLSAVIYSCGQKDISKTYVARPLTVTEKFNESAEPGDTALKIVKYAGNGKEEAGKELFSIKYKDTLVTIKLSETDTSAGTAKLAFASFVNTQKTAALVQIADESGLTAPFFIVALKDGKLDVSSLYRASIGAKDSEYTKGLTKIGRNGYLINNDFFVANVNAKVYVLKRQNPDERIQGEFMTNSPDKTTLVFLTPATSSIYQVNYVSNQSLDQKLSKEANADAYRHVQKSFTWQANSGGVYFFKPDKVVDISSFK